VLTWTEFPNFSCAERIHEEYYNGKKEYINESEFVYEDPLRAGIHTIKKA